jgi:hypothetical protein
MEKHDISLLLRSHATILVVETHEELRAIEMMKDIAIGMGFSIFQWSVSVGLQRIDLLMDPQVHLKEPAVSRSWRRRCVTTIAGWC